VCVGVWVGASGVGCLHKWGLGVLTHCCCRQGVHPFCWLPGSAVYLLQAIRKTCQLLHRHAKDTVGAAAAADLHGVCKGCHCCKFNLLSC
jgi:hypothetical protein